MSDAPEKILLCIRPHVSRLTGQALWYENGEPVPYIAQGDVEQESYTRTDIAEKRIRELEAENRRIISAHKKMAVAFFFWWYNQPGANTEQGYDQWIEAGMPGALEDGG